MKNLFYSLCLLIGFSSQAQSLDYQTNRTNTNLSQKVFSVTTDYFTNLIFNANNENVEEQDEAFDFDIKKYLPANFNAFAGMFIDYELAQVEEDEAFDFDTAQYLPVGFNANATYLDDITEIAIVEEDEAFDFNTADYLPVGFNVYPILEEIVEVEIIEEDEPFDFNTNDYLPNNFDAHATEDYAKNMYYLWCIAPTTI